MWPIHHNFPALRFVAAILAAFSLAFFAALCFAQNSAMALDGTAADPLQKSPGKVVVIVFVRTDCRARIAMLRPSSASAPSTKAGRRSGWRTRTVPNRRKKFVSMNVNTITSSPPCATRNAGHTRSGCVRHQPPSGVPRPHRRLVPGSWPRPSCADHSRTRRCDPGRSQRTYASGQRPWRGVLYFGPRMTRALRTLALILGISIANYHRFVQLLQGLPSRVPGISRPRVVSTGNPCRTSCKVDEANKCAFSEGISNDESGIWVLNGQRCKLDGSRGCGPF